MWMETGRHCCSGALTKGLTRSLFEKHTQRLMGEPWIFPDDSTAVKGGTGASNRHRDCVELPCGGR